MAHRQSRRNPAGRSGSGGLEPWERRRRRQRVIVWSAAVILVVGIVGGVIAAFSTRSNQGTTTSTTSTLATTSVPPTSAAPTTTLPPPAPTTALFTRSTAAGVTIRASWGPVVPSAPAKTSAGASPGSHPGPGGAIVGSAGSSGGAATASSCPSTRFVLAALSYRGAQGTATGTVYVDTPQPDSLEAASTGSFAAPGSAGVQWVIAASGSQATTLRAMFTDGSTDQMSPVGGVAVLAHPLGAGQASSVQVQELGPGGVVAASVSIGGSGAASAQHSGLPPGC